jgi:hypothetical protein
LTRLIRRPKIKQALKVSQLKLGELDKAMRKLKVQSATLLANQPKRRQKSKNVPNEIAKHDSEISLLGRKFCIMVDPFLTSTTVFAGPRPDLAADSVYRYDSDITIEQGLIAEVYDFIPEKFHEMMASHSHFATLVRGYFCLVTTSLTILCEVPGQNQ